MDSRISLNGRDSGIVDVSAWASRPFEPLLPAPEPATARAPRNHLALARDVAILLAALSLLAVELGSWSTRSSSDRLPKSPASDKTAPMVASEPAVTPIVTAPEPAPAIEAEPPATPRVTARVPQRIERPRAPAEAPAPTATAVPEHTARTLDELMGQATATSLPDVPDRQEVARVLRSLDERVAACRPQGMDHTVVTTRVTIDGATGRVARAVVDGDPQWSAAGACIVEALSGARFSPFARDRFEIQFPYRL